MKVISMSVADLLLEVSENSEHAFLQVSYDHVDDKNKKSQNAISHLLMEAGFGELSEVVTNHKHYVKIADLKYALHAHDFLNEHSAAVGTHLYYKGKHGKEAETLILAKVKQSE